MSGYAIQAAIWENSKARGITKLVLLAIAKHADREGIAWPSSAKIADDVGIGRSHVFEHLKRLEEMGELVVVEPGTPRRATRYRVVPPSAKQTELMPRSNARRTSGKAVAAQPIRLFAGVRYGDTRCPPNGPQGSATGTPGVPTSKHEPINEPSNELTNELVPRAASGASLMREIRREDRQQLAEARTAWLQGRAKAHLTRYTDARALSALRIAVGRALNEGAEWRDIVRAIRTHAGDPKANPWYADQWIREARYEREQNAAIDRMVAKRAEEDRVPRPPAALHHVSATAIVAAIS